MFTEDTEQEIIQKLKEHIFVVNQPQPGAASKICTCEMHVSLLTFGGSFLSMAIAPFKC